MDGTLPVVPPPPCAISGWALVRKAEADSSGKDRFARQTCDVRSDVSMFIPTGVKPDENKVHVCFTANEVSGDVTNSVTCHAMRFAHSTTDWILVAVKGRQNPDGTIPANWVSAADIRGFLRTHGRPDRLDHLRLSCHSRGLFNLTGSLNSKRLVATSPTPPVVDPSLVDRVVTFDEDDASANLTGSVVAAGIDRGKLFGYRVNAGMSPTGHWGIPAARTVWFTSSTLLSEGLRSVEYCRVIDDAKALRPGLVIPPAIGTMVTGMGLPALGNFTSRISAPPALNFRDFCTTNKTKIDAALQGEIVRGIPSALYSFVDGNDLGRLGGSFTPGVYAHHMFVCEFFHEVLDAAPPSPL